MNTKCQLIFLYYKKRENTETSILILLLSPLFAYWKVQHDSRVYMWRGGLRLLKYDLTLWQNACNCLLIYHRTIQNCTEKNHLQKIFLLIFQSNNYCSVLFKKRCGLRSSNLLKENSVNNVFLRVIFSFHNTLTATYKYARRTTLHIYSTDKVLPNGHTDMVWNFL